MSPKIVAALLRNKSRLLRSFYPRETIQVSWYQNYPPTLTDLTTHDDLLCLSHYMMTDLVIRFGLTGYMNYGRRNGCP